MNLAKKLSGVFAALTTPFENGNLSLDKFKANLARYNKTNLAGYVVLGSTGEAVFLSDEEAEGIVKEARASTALPKKIIVGTSRESTRATIEFTNRMAKLGADFALLKPPHYYKALMTPQALARHFSSVADNVGIPIIIYNIPQNTGIPATPSLLVELSRHPNVAGVKDSSGILSNLTETIPRARADFSFLIGAGSVFLPGLLMGATGGILAIAAVIPDLCTRLFDLFEEGNIDEAKKIQLQLVPLNKLLTQTLGVPALKYALDLLGFYGGLPRSPLLPLDEKGKKEVRDELMRLDLL